jgi:hypothetical protein
MATLPDMKAQMVVDHWKSMKAYIQHHLDELHETHLSHKNVTQRALALEEPWFKALVESTKLFLSHADEHLVQARKEQAIVTKFTKTQ